VSDGFDLDTCKYVIWGAKDGLNTFGHVHNAFLRALKFLGKEVYYLDRSDDISRMDFSNTLFLSMNCVVKGMPQREDCFYVVHNAMGDPCQEYFKGLKLLPYGVHIISNRYGYDVEQIGPDIYFDQAHRSLVFYWGTDLLPHEIEANKPDRVFNSGSREFNNIGSLDEMKRPGIEGFVRACNENGIAYHNYGGYNGGEIVSVEKHIRLIKRSYMAPAFQGADQVAQGYISCRIPKNISYGQPGIVHSAYANQVFDNKLIFDTDTYRLFYKAKEYLQSMPLKELHDQMDLVAARHTYLNKIAGIQHAVRALEAEHS
jgi:hypothetical protein